MDGLPGRDDVGESGKVAIATAYVVVALTSLT